MERILCSQVAENIGRQVLLCGWVHRVRRLGSITFLVLKDRSGLIQATLEGQPAEVELNLEVETVISLKGTAVAEPRAPGGAEVRISSLDVMNRATRAMPFEVNKKEVNAGLDLILEHRVLSLRNPRLHAIFTIQSELCRAFREFLRSQGFTEIHTPKIVATGTEGGSELFAVQYFDRRAYLAQSPQFYKQMMVGAGYERVFEVAPVYRAEEHNTSRHLNEYLSLDFEMGFIEDENDIMTMENRLLRHTFEYLAETCPSEFALHGEVVPEVGEIPRLTLAEAHAALERRFGKISPRGNLDPEGERLLCQYVGEPALVFVTRWPAEVRPMYAMPCPEEPHLTRSFDLLFRGLEITTGGQRIHQPDLLERNIRNRGLDPAGFSHYLEVFHYGMPPHGGLAIGAERLTARLLNLANVREASTFPRDRERLQP